MNIKQAIAIIDKHFDPIVEQCAAKAQLRDIILGGLLEGGFMPPVVLIAPKGIGKTKIMRALKAIVKEVFGRTNVWINTGKELGTVSSFFEDVLLEHFNGKEANLFVDELHEAPPVMQNILRTMMEPTVERDAKTVRHADYSVDIHPCLHGLFFATNKVQLVDEALLSRAERIDLSLYTDEGMEQILFNGLQGAGVTFHDNTLRAIAQCNRGTARDVVQWVNAVRRHVAIKGKSTVNKADVAEIIRKRETFPLGVSKNELNTLLILETHGEQQLKEIAAKNRCASDEQLSNEIYLLSRGLMTIDVKRKLTPIGRDYLQSLRDDGFIDARPKAANVE